jgi:glycerol uptake facilitator-like aquaporin
LHIPASLSSSLPQIPWLKAILYCLAQLLGSTFGTLCSAWMSPDMQNFGGGKIGCLGVGVFEPRPNVGPFQVFFWEFGMTFILVSTILSCCCNTPSWGNVSPLIIGISIFSTVVAGGQFTGGAVNPARFFSASIVYGCSLDKIHLCAPPVPLHSLPISSCFTEK